MPTDIRHGGIIKQQLKLTTKSVIVLILLNRRTDQNLQANVSQLKNPVNSSLQKKDVGMEAHTKMLDATLTNLKPINR